MPSSVRPVSSVIALAALLGTAALASPPSDDWVVVSTNDGRVAIHPRSGEQRELPASRAGGLVSPDGKRLLLLEEPTKDGKPQIIVSDRVPTSDEPAEPAAANPRTVRLPVRSVRDLAWTHDSNAILFLTDHPDGSQVCLLELPAAAPSPPPAPRVISGKAERCFNPRAASDGRIAWAIHREQRGKEAIYDLVIAEAEEIEKIATPTRPQEDFQQQSPVPATPTSEHTPVPTKVLRTRVNLHTFEFSPDASKLAFAASTSLFIHDFPSDSTKEIKFSELNEKFYAHGVQRLAWRRDGGALCGFVTFLGGRSTAPGARPGDADDFTMLGDLELFVFPLDADPFWVTRPRRSSSPGWIPEDQLPPAPVRP